MEENAICIMRGSQFRPLRFAIEGTLPPPSILEEPIYFTDSDVLDKDGRQLQADVPKPGNLPIVAYK